MRKELKTLGAILAVGVGLTFAESDKSRLKPLEFISYRGKPAVKVTADLSDSSVSRNRYVIEYSTNLVDGAWITDNQVLTSESPSRTFMNQPTNCYYRLKKVAE